MQQNPWNWEFLLITDRDLFCLNFMYTETGPERLRNYLRSYMVSCTVKTGIHISFFLETALVYHNYDSRILNDNLKDTVILSFSEV